MLGLGVHRTEARRRRYRVDNIPCSSNRPSENNRASSAEPTTDSKSDCPYFQMLQNDLEAASSLSLKAIGRALCQSGTESFCSCGLLSLARRLREAESSALYESEAIKLIKLAGGPKSDDIKYIDVCPPYVQLVDLCHSVIQDEDDGPAVKSACLYILRQLNDLSKKGLLQRAFDRKDVTFKPGDTAKDLDVVLSLLDQVSFFTPLPEICSEHSSVYLQTLSSFCTQIIARISNEDVSEFIASEPSEFALKFEESSKFLFNSLMYSLSALKEFLCQPTASDNPLVVCHSVYLLYSLHLFPCLNSGIPEPFTLTGSVPPELPLLQTILFAFKTVDISTLTPLIGLLDEYVGILFEMLNEYVHSEDCFFTKSLRPDFVSLFSDAGPPAHIGIIVVSLLSSCVSANIIPLSDLRGAEYAPLIRHALDYALSTPQDTQIMHGCYLLVAHVFTDPVLAARLSTDPALKTLVTARLRRSTFEQDLQNAVMGEGEQNSKDPAIARLHIRVATQTLRSSSSASTATIVLSACTLLSFNSIRDPFFGDLPSLEKQTPLATFSRARLEAVTPKDPDMDLDFTSERPRLAASLHYRLQLLQALAGGLRHPNDNIGRTFDMVTTQLVAFVSFMTWLENCVEPKLHGKSPQQVLEYLGPIVPLLLMDVCRETARVLRAIGGLPAKTPQMVQGGRAELAAAEQTAKRSRSASVQERLRFRNQLRELEAELKALPTQRKRMLAIGWRSQITAPLERRALRNARFYGALARDVLEAAELQ